MMQLEGRISEALPLPEGPRSLRFHDALRVRHLLPLLLLATMLSRRDAGDLLGRALRV